MMDTVIRVIGQQTCPVCGRTFVREPRGTGYGFGSRDVCSWPCQRKLEARYQSVKELGLSDSATHYVLAGDDAGKPDKIIQWRLDAARMIREGVDVPEIAEAAQVCKSVVYKLRLTLSDMDGVNYAALARQNKRERQKAMKGEKNVELARQMLQAGEEWTKILRAAHIGAKDLAALRREMDAAPEEATQPVEEAAPTVEAAPEQTDALKTLEGFTPYALEQPAEAEPSEPESAPEPRKRRAPQPKQPAGRQLSAQDERELLWAAGVIEMYIDIRPDNSAGRRAVEILRRIAGLEA